MVIEIDFESDEAIYRQLCRKIIFEIAASRLRDGDTLPSVRELADTIGINMHTVNKAYSLLRDEGFLRVDSRRGTVVYVDAGRVRAEEELKKELKAALAKASCRNISRQEVHNFVDEIIDQMNR